MYLKYPKKPNNIIRLLFFYLIMRLLLTGGAGFIGSNLINYYINSPSIETIVCVDNLSYAGNLNNLSETTKISSKFQFYQLNINNTLAIRDIIERHKIDCIIHMAAESHVDNSINDPLIFAKSNTLGTLSMLEAARVAWTDFAGKMFVYVSTDEVYGSIEQGSFTEHSPYMPNSPYSASKAAGDMYCRSYYETYKLPVIVTHCSNNYGANQHKEKFIPTVINSIKCGKKVPVYGNGLNIRNWIHVHDHNSGILSAAVLGQPGQTYNFGGDVELTNIDIVKIICELLEVNYDEVVEFVDDRKGHDYRYSVDSSKACKKLYWKPVITFEQGIAALVDSYKS